MKYDLYADIRLIRNTVHLYVIAFDFPSPNSIFLFLAKDPFLFWYGKEGIKTKSDGIYTRPTSNLKLYLYTWNRFLAPT